MDEALELFRDWSSRNNVHLNRHLSILTRHADMFAGYIALIKTYPVNSPEFYDIMANLHKKAIALTEEMKETNESFVSDCDDLKNVLMKMKESILVLNKND